MRPIISIVGRANVGKSTLFNRLIRKRKAIVHDQPGVTRDVLFHDLMLNETPVWLVDSGGLGFEPGSRMSQEVEAQVHQLIEESTFVILLVDGKAGLHTLDEEVARLLRKKAKEVIMVINKVDPGTREDPAPEFLRLGFKKFFQVSAEHGLGCLELEEGLSDILEEKELPAHVEKDAATDGIHVVFIGRPNVGKSSLINAIIQKDRLIVSDIAGTTRDTIEVPFQFSGKAFVLLDTAGIRKKAKVVDNVEFFSITRSLQALEKAHVAILVIDGVENITTQDEKIAASVIEHGVGICIAANKWDLCQDSEKNRDIFREELYSRAPFLKFADVRFTSATESLGLMNLLTHALAIHDKQKKDITPEELNRAFEKIHAIAPSGGSPAAHMSIKGLKYSHVKHPVFYVKCNRPDLIPKHIESYWKNALYKEFNFRGVPLDVQFTKPKKNSDSFSKSKAKAKVLKAIAKSEQSIKKKKHQRK